MFVYVGFWTNWAQGPVYGLTLTMGGFYAKILIGFIAFFVTWGRLSFPLRRHHEALGTAQSRHPTLDLLMAHCTVGTRLWRILCFTLHFSLSSEKPRDALHHQRQAIIRNAADAETGILSNLVLMCAW